MVSFLLAFFLHSSLWLGLAWLVFRLRPGASARSREWLWKTALAASLVGPLAQQLPGFQPLPGWQLVTPHAEAAVEPLAATPPVTVVVPSLPAAENPATHVHFEEPVQVATTTPLSWLPNWVTRLGGHWAVAWAVLALLLLMNALVRLGAFHHRIRQRRPVQDLRLQRSLVRLSHAAGLRRVPRLSQSADLASPAAFGVWRREICLPDRWCDLSAVQQDSMLAHEVAHHMRRDPLWLLLLQAAERLFFFQPLVGIARRHLMEAIEQRCDAWGAQQTGDPLAMARVLTEVAGWLQPRGRAIPVPAMARRRSLLRQRMQRLIEGQPEPVQQRGVRASLLAAAVLAGAPFATPALVPAANGESADLSFTVEALPSSPAVDQLLQPFDFELAALELQVAELQIDLGPLQYQSPYQEMLTSIRNRLGRLRLMRGLIADLLQFLSTVPDAVAAADEPFETQN